MGNAEHDDALRGEIAGMFDEFSRMPDLDRNGGRRTNTGARVWIPEGCRCRTLTFSPCFDESEKLVRFDLYDSFGNFVGIEEVQG